MRSRNRLVRGLAVDEALTGAGDHGLLDQPLLIEAVAQALGALVGVVTQALEQVVRTHELLEVGEDRGGFDQVFVRLGFAGVAGQALDAVDRKSPTPTSKSGTLHRWNDEACSPPVVHMATGFGDLTNE